MAEGCRHGQLFSFCLIMFIKIVNSFQDIKPTQVHIALGVTIDQITVTWSTKNDTKTSYVVHSITDLSHGNITQGTSSKFVDATKTNTQYIHHVTLTGLKPGQKYLYMCGTKLAWSESFSFTTLKDGNNWSPRFVFYGDLGFVNGQSIPRLTEDVEKELYDVALHIGDMGYDLKDDNGTRGDKFFNKIQPVAANVPYMTCPGNHEHAQNFTQYKRRLYMPGDELGDRLFYSFDVGPVHIISISTEFYFYIWYGVLQVKHMYDWLENDLKIANLAENRIKRPWIITMGHRPMYCSNTDHNDCTDNESIVRVGVPILHLFGLEELWNKYGVDLALWAHEHTYERLWPVYNRKVYNGSYEHPYTNPGAPVHITTGSAGCQEDHDHFKKKKPYWSAKRIVDYGYTRMTVYNSTHLYAEEVSDDKGGVVVDTMWLIKDKHGPYINTMQVIGEK